MTREKCIQRIGELIRDENVKNFVFGTRYRDSSFLTTIDEINGYYSRVLNLAFTLIYAKFNDWKYGGKRTRTESDLSNVKSLNSFRRVSKTLTELYTDKGLNYSIIEPTIMDIQLDKSYNGALSNKLGFRQLFSQDDGHKFAAFTRQAAIYRDSTRFEGEDGKPENIEKKYSDLISYIKLFPFLSSIRIELVPVNESNYGKSFVLYEVEQFDDDGNVTGTVKKTAPSSLFNVKIVIMDDEEDQELDTYLTLINSSGYYYFLQDIINDRTESSRTENLLLCNYASIGRDDDFFRINVTSDTSYVARSNEIMVYSDTACADIRRNLHLDVAEREKMYLIKDFYAINYRYVKPLTLSICDILKEDDERNIREYYLGIKFKNKYKDLFEYSPSWDTKIAVLIVKESATNVLKVIFANRPDAYSELFSSLHSRLGADVFDKEKLAKIIREEQKIAFDRWKVKYFGSHQDDAEETITVVSEERKVINAEVCAMQLIAYLSDILKVDESRDKVYKNNYPLNINSHIRMLENLKDSGLSLDKIKRRALSIVSNTLRVLYLFYCGFFKYVEVKSKYKAESKKRVISVKEINNYQTKANDAFREEVRLRVSELKTEETSIANFVAKLIQLNEECKFSNNDNHKNVIIREYLGRYQLLDNSKIEPLITLTSFDDNDDEVTIKNKINGILEVYEYFKEGDDDYSGVDGIYPYVGTYEYSHETRDGYKIAHFSMSGFNNDMDIEVLSEFRYSVNSKYYCLPNKLCCENDRIKLWIEPTLIDYKQLMVVDELFRDSEMSDLYTFEKLKSRKDYADTARLIFNTDPYIYKDLFGDEEASCNVLAFSFDNPKSLFFKDYVYVVRDNQTKKIVGTSLFHPNGFVWHDEDMEIDFENAEVPRPETYQEVCKYMSKTYNTVKIGCSACNISIHPDFRRKGVGIFMLRRLIKEANDNTIELTVLKSNNAAINLYSKLGFKILGESFADYGNGSDHGEESYKMIRNGK